VATGGAVDDTESVKTLHHAYERGINFVDTAELYGCGHSEEVIGEPLRQSTQDRPSIKTGGPSTTATITLRRC
jgi:aryl-alcohol dehydrogenase-like predicted oxidoreductase